MGVVFRSDDVPVGSRLDLLRQISADAVVPLEVRIAQPAFGGRIITGRVGVSQVFELTLDTRAEAFRTARLIRRSDPEVYKVDVITQGQMVVGQDGRQARLGPGDLSIFDMSRPAFWVNQPTRFVVVTFPKALLPLRVDDVATVTGTRVAGDRGAGALISMLARRMPRHVDDCGAPDGARLGTALVDLIMAALAARLDRVSAMPEETRQNALLQRIHAFIEARLSDTGLSPATIAAAHHISVRYLHKLFTTEKLSVSAWIRRRRLELCRRDLRDPALQARPVAAVGAQWGFASPTQFNRAFRAEFGMPPGEYRLISTGQMDH